MFVKPACLSAVYFSSKMGNLMNKFTRWTTHPLEDQFPDITNGSTIMAKLLDEEIYQRLRQRCTTNGFTIDNVIQPGIDNPGHPFSMTVGCVAGDEETYDVFRELMDSVIQEKHGGYKPTDTHTTDLDPNKLKGGDDLDTSYVLSSRIRTDRNIRGFCLMPNINRGQRRAIEKLSVKALSALGGDLKGKYYSLKNMTEAKQQQLIDDNFLFDKPVSPMLLSSGMARDWPDARGIWHNDNKTFLVWVNNEEHIRVTAVQKGGNMKEAFNRFCTGLTKIEEVFTNKGYEFMSNEHHGYIASSPANIGTALSTTVYVKLPILSKCRQFQQILERLRLQTCGTGGVNTVFDISNTDRLGISEVELVQMVVDGVKLLIEMEKQLEKGQPIQDLLPAQK